MLLAMRALALCFFLMGTFGCKLVDAQPKGRSPLVPATTASNAITLEVFSAPVPLGVPQLAALWAQVDEQSLPAESRKKLSENGLRAGIVGPSVPDSLASMLNVTDQQITADKRAQMPLETEQGITLVVMQPRSGERRDLVTSQSYDEIALLRRVDQQVKGKTYYKAEGRLALRVFSEPDGRVRLELTPELHHGEFRNHVTPSDGMMTWKQERQKQLFPELKLGGVLAPGQMFLVTCHADRPGSVGHYFFTHLQGEKPMQKLYVFRVAQAAPDRSFYEAPADATGPLASDAP